MDKMSNAGGMLVLLQPQKVEETMSRALSLKNQQLMRQFPFLEKVLLQPMEPSDLDTIKNLSIKVERADGNLMFKRADNVGIDGSGAMIFSMTNNHKNHVAKKGEYLFAIDDSDFIINRVDWPKGRNERRKNGETYGHFIFWMKNDPVRKTLSFPIHNDVKYLVWVSVEMWYADTKSDNFVERFGKPLSRDIWITIYRKPEEGFLKLEENSSLVENLQLDSDTLMRAVFEKNQDILVIGGRLDELCKQFQDEVYFNGMKEIFNAGKFRGASGKFGSVEVLCAEMCGYDRIMLQDSMSWVSFQLRPGQENLYVLGECGTLPQIRNLVNTVMKAWQKEENRALFVSNKEVGVM